MLNYLKEFFEIKERQEERENEALKRKLSASKIPPGDSENLQLKAKQLACNYVGFILKRSLTQIHASDQVLYETILYYASRVMTNAFTAEHEAEIETELNRLLRSNTFNIS